MDEVRYYSVRRLSPYQGTVQVVELPGFRAMSMDGETWRVQMFKQGVRFSTYATWRADGRGDLIATARTEAFVEALHRHPALPFPLADILELWLLDAKERMPLALLASTLEHMAPPRVTYTTWRAALAEDEGFVATSLAPSGAPVSHVPHHEVLNRCVRKAAGAQPVAQWFLRDAQGCGVGLNDCDGDPALQGRELDQARFPELLVREDWESETEAGLVRDYHDWQAPGLLTHTNLRRATRARLEHAACRQAGKLYRVHRLLPELLDPDLIKVALVEAVLRRAAAP